MISRWNTIPRFGLPYTWSDFRAACSAIASSGPGPEQFDLLGTAPKFWTGSGRQALRFLLGTLHLRPDSGVAVPLFTDPSVVSAIAAAGHRPVFVDIDPVTLTLDPISLWRARGDFSAVVIVHLFGHVADLPALLEAAGDHPAIEDTAHAPLSYLGGRMVGGFAQASFYSFGSTKYWPAGGGGLAVINDSEMAREFARVAARLAPPSRPAECRKLLLQAAKTLLFQRGVYGIAGGPLRRWLQRYSLLEPSMDLQAIGRMHAAVALRQAERFPARVERHRRNSVRLLAQLAAVEEVGLPRERPGVRYNYHLFPVLLRDAQERATVAAEMWSNGVDTSQIYFDVAEQCRHYGYRGGCPISESVAERLLTLPNHAALTDRDVDRVADVFLRALRMSRRNRAAQSSERYEASSYR